MPNLVTLTVEEPDKILNAGAYGAGALIRLQSAATEAGAFTDVTGAGSTPTSVVVAGQRAYDAYDPNGTVSTWYRTRFENATATRLSDWSAAFQVAPEGSGLICALWDVKQALGYAPTDTSADEDLLDRIRQVTTEILSFTGRQFVRDPASGVTTWTEDVGDDALLVSNGGRVLWYPKGLAAVTVLEVATSSQPETGGTYATVPAAEWFLRPTVGRRDYGWPATRIEISDLSGSRVYPGYNTVRLTGARGFATVPANIAAVGERAVIASFLAKGSAGASAVIGPNGGTTILRHISPADRETLTRYAVVNV